LTPLLFETGGKHTHYLHYVVKGYSQHKHTLRTHIDATSNHNCVNNTCNCYLHCSPRQKVTHIVLHALLHKNVIVPIKKHVFHSHTARCFVTPRPCFVSVFCQSQDLVSVCSHLRAFCSTSHTQRLVALLMLAIHLQLSLVLFCYLQYFYTQPKVFCVFTTRCLFVFFTDSPKLCLSLPPLIAKRFNESCSGVSKYRSWNDPRAGFPVFVDFIFFSVFDVNFQICSPVSSSY